jgi:hypothetical protein
MPVTLPRRIAGLFTHPAAEWAVIASEKTDLAVLYGRYVAILAALPAAAILTGLAISGGRYLGVAGILTAVTAALVSYAMAIALPFATALALATLAPKFKSDGGTSEAMKLLAYASTPFWLAGIFYAFVSLSRMVVVGGLYAIYLLFLGLTPVMGTPVEQRVPFTLVAVIVLLAVNIALSWIVGLAHLPYYGF